MKWPRDIPFDPARRRYYQLDSSFRHNPSDYDLLNPLEVYPVTATLSGDTVPITAGPRKYVAWGSSTKSSYGLPALLAKPRVIVAHRNKPLDIYGFLTRRLVSSRARELLHAIDPEGFDFAECDTVTRGGRPIEPYWLMDVARLAPGFDKSRSVFDIRHGEDGSTGEKYSRIGDLYDIHMSPDLPADHHVFLLPEHSLHMVFDEVLADAWRAHGFLGASFQPMQPPTRRERSPAALRYANFDYWYNGRYRERTAEA